MVGDGARELVRRLLAASALDVPLDNALERFLEEYNRRLVATTRPYDGIVEMLDRVATIARLAVLTNKPEHATRRLLAALDLDRFFLGCHRRRHRRGAEAGSCGIALARSTRRAALDTRLDGWRLRC